MRWPLDSLTLHFFLMSSLHMLLTFLVGTGEELDLDRNPEPGTEEVPADVVTMTQKTEASVHQKNFSRRSGAFMNTYRTADLSLIYFPAILISILSLSVPTFPKVSSAFSETFAQTGSLFSSLPLHPVQRHPLQKLPFLRNWSSHCWDNFSSRLSFQAVNTLSAPPHLLISSFTHLPW